MSIQLFQLAQVLIWCLLLFLIYKVKNNKVKFIFIFIGLVLFFVNPIRFKQEGISKIERRYTETIEIPDKVIAAKKKFSEKQSNEMEILKKQSMETFKK